MKILRNKNLKNHNTLGLNVFAKYYASPANKDELLALLRNPQYSGLSKMVLGSGSNVLFTSDYDGLVIHPAMQEIVVTGEDENYLFIRVGAGVVWDDLVRYTVAKGWGGLENLSWIPGCVGAAPVQNIGAYGAEAKDTITEVEYTDITTGEETIIKGEDCRFGYRDSIFKRELKSKVIITYVSFKLSKLPLINSNYADVSQALQGFDCPTIQNLRDIIIDIRKRKLPDPAEVGNAGSFFKNPVVSDGVANSIRMSHPTLRIFPATEGFCKLPAAWLIEQCGFKGKRYGSVGVHAIQPLVLLAYEGASGEELIKLSDMIRKTVFEKFGVEIEPEVNVY
ncbi:MAG: UDP-N-acetylmuramate dehydrogenase [Bacteroidales bacterium]|jgi:UDP-N-acetylmuramate dehydrogenase